ncbi:transposase [Rhodovulum sulfidophilum]|nr:transposase [Rhodovulum sulfidophilum]
MSGIITVGLDLAKNVFQFHGADAAGRAVLRKKLRRDQVLAFFGQLPSCVVAMEACGSAITGAARSASRAMKCG